MWLEAIISRQDLVALLPQFTPVTIHLSGGGSVELEEPEDVELLTDQGLRFTCKAKLHWPVLGVQVPVTLHSLTAVVKPQIAGTPSGDRLVFSMSIEKADFAGIPEMVDVKITEKINEALARDHIELEWDFTKTLSYVFPLPATLEQLESLGLEVAWGEVRATEDALVLAVSFHARVARKHGIPASVPARRDDEATTPASTH